MKLTTTSAAIILAYTCAIQAAPATVGAEHELVARDTDLIQGYVDNMNDYIKKRDTMSDIDISKRESQIVTDVLKAIKETDLAPGILKYFTTNSFFKPIVINTTVTLIKSGIVNIDTLLKSLNDSGLAVDVIQNLIEDCTFYSDIYKLALGYISNLGQKVADNVNSKRSFTMVPVEQFKREDVGQDLAARDTQDIITSLMESLKNSGLANQVVRELIVDPEFLEFGADLIKKLFEEDAITIGEIIDALLDSGLIPSLFKAFLNLGTFNTVITNALAAALGKCDEQSITTASASTTVSDSPSPSSTGGSGVCRKKKRSTY